MFPAEFHPEASLEIAEAIQLSENHKEKVLFEAELDEAICVVRENPYICRDRDDHFKFNLSLLPFYLPYILLGNSIFFLAFAHNSRRPGYWKDRLPN